MFKNTFYASLICLSGAALIGCVTPEAKQTPNLVNEFSATEKPGAAVSFSSESPKNLQISENGVVKIIVTDGYDSGTLKLSAVTEGDLRLVSETAQTEFSMSGADSHEWALDVTASAKGVYYINVFAEALTPNDDAPQLRSYSVRVQVGNLTEAEMKQSLQTNGTLSMIEGVVVMDAEEVIK